LREREDSFSKIWHVKSNLRNCTWLGKNSSSKYLLVSYHGLNQNNHGLP
jgi:hypothetical protein